MFSGIIKEVGEVLTLDKKKDYTRVRIRTSLQHLEEGNSIAVNGVCQTIMATENNSFEVESVATTLEKTNFLNLEVGVPVNLEPALRLNDYVDGHLVQGHVQGVGTVRAINTFTGNTQITIQLPPELLSSCVPEGSITLDGISLTIAARYSDAIMVSIVPYTLTHTIVQYWRVQTKVNVECDIIGRYLQVMLQQPKKNVVAADTDYTPPSAERAKRAIEALRNKEMIIVFDSETRENEGDFVIPAEEVTREQITFMARHGCGLICQAITREQAEKLALPLMVQENTSLHETAFTVSVDASKGTTTGISAEERALTARLLASPTSTKDDFCKPGHVFPIIAEKEGLKKRRGHTEAAVALAQWAGYKPSALICEILNADGSMARLKDLITIAVLYDMQLVSIADLIEYRSIIQ